MALRSTKLRIYFDLSNKSSWKKLKFLKKLGKELKK